MRTGIFVGSFDPYTIGHQSVVKRILPLFDKLVIGVGINDKKQYTCSGEERVKRIAAIYAQEKHIEVKAYHDLTIDFAQVKGSGRIDHEIAKYALKSINIDQYGLDEIDNKILTTIIDKFKGGPVGLSTIATAIGEDTGTVEEVYEPFLIMEGFIKRTPRGRMATQLAYEHLGRNPYQGNIMEPELF